MALGPRTDLPYSDHFASTGQYVDSLLAFAESNALLKKLCGGVHILDFFTNEPDLYSQILSEEWRVFIQAHEIGSFLDLLLREPLDALQEQDHGWRHGPSPPASLFAYIAEVRKHLLQRQPAASQCARNRAVKPAQKMAWRVAVGMNMKKVHEVGLFASYINQLTHSISLATDRQISHLVDFGSGQNYLGRALASLPYSKNIVAIETKGHNQDRAKQLDAIAKLSSRQRYRHEKTASSQGISPEQVSPTGALDKSGLTEGKEARTLVKVEPAEAGVGQVQYVEHHIEDGNLQHVVQQIGDATSPADHSNGTSLSIVDKKNLLVMSLHSCGNLVHHGLRSLMMNDDVKAVAMVGCCYNLITERLSPATYKLPELRPSAHPRDEQETMAGDPHGFPMSERLCNMAKHGVRLNITARMMAVQAPDNWGEKDSEGFFTRHFYRALLQRIFLDKGVVGLPSSQHVSGSPLGHSSGTPIIIGSLRKSCYESFTSYVRGALAKLYQDPEGGDTFKEKLAGLTDQDIQQYEQDFAHRKKQLSAIWSLMAFSAGVVEALILTDRYLWLKEQKDVQQAWVEPVFDYAISPRNLVVVGIKK